MENQLGNYWHPSIQKALFIVQSIFMISTTMAQVATLEEHWIIIPLVSTNCIAWIYFGTIYFKHRDTFPSSRAINQMSSLISSTDLSFRFVEIKTELDYVWRVDSINYGQFNISKQTLYEWFGKYNSGCLLMFLGQEFSGYVGIYPLHTRSFDDLRARVLKEDRISGGDLCSWSESVECTTWYFSGVAILHDPLFISLIAGALSRWAEKLPDHKRVEAISYAFPGNDAVMLNKLGFIEIEKKLSDTELAIVHRTFTKSEVLKLAGDLLKGALKSS